jgi:FkbM family methyltransferase
MIFNGQKYIGATETTDEFLFRELYSKIEPGFFIECGALNGVSISNCKILEDFLGWTGLNIEPSEAFNQLILNRPKAINIRAALGNKDFEILNFKEDTTNYAASSFNENLIQNSHIIKNSYIITYTYKTLVSILGIKKVDFFSLDVEGYEINVLNGMIGSDTLPSYIFIETHYSNKEDIYSILTNMGYVRVAFFHLDELFKLTGRNGPDNINGFI